MRLAALGVVLGIGVGAGCGGRHRAEPAVAPPAPAPPDPLRFDASDVDRTVAPCADFYQYACGTWMASHPIPADRSSWDPYYQLAQRNTDNVRAILEGREPGASEEYTKVKDFYAACMDEGAIEGQGLAPLRAEVQRLPADPVAALAAVHTLGQDALFSFYASIDLKDSTRMIATIDLPWLGMRDRNLYLVDDANAQKLRPAYREHVAHMLAATGLPDDAAEAGADAVLHIETELAKVMPTREQRRDPAAFYHKIPRAQLDTLEPGWPWQQYLDALHAPAVPEINVAWPDALRAAIALWNGLAPEQRSAYLRWHVAHALGDALPAAQVADWFTFYGTLLRGTKEMPPRWKRCASATNDALGEAVGKVFVARHFSAEQKPRVVAQMRAIMAALHDDLAALPWMSDATRAEALRKLDAFGMKIGYPDTWWDYSALAVRRDDTLGNIARGARFGYARDLAKIGKPVERADWYLLPQTVDGFESSQRVEIVFTAGILQPPFFDPGADDAVNYGAIGRAMGHELIHGFDDEGRKFDREGNMRDWWTPADAAQFEQRAQCLVDEYSAFEVVDGKTLNGKLTLGENLADNGGIRLAYAALEHQLAGKPRPAIDGLTPEQRFFLAFAKTQCANTTPETERERLTQDPHSPGRWRVNGTVRNLPEFAQAYGCKAGDAMVSATPCRVW